MADENKNEDKIIRIDRTAYPSASKKSQESEKEVEKRPEVKKIVEGEVRQRKGFGTKFREVMVADDVQNVGSYILFDIAIPAFKNFIADSVTQGIQRTLFGGSAPVNTRKGNNVTQTMYNKVYSSSTPDPYSKARENTINRRSNSRFVGDIELGSREEAVRILDTLTSMIDDYGVARIADLYGLVGITSSFTDNDWGWTNLSQSGVSLGRGGWYILNLPRPEHLS